MSLRPAQPEDEVLLRRLFAADKAAEFAAAGIPEAVYRPLIEMQYQSRAASYSADYPEAERWILCSGAEAVGHMLLLKTSQGSRLADLAVLPQFRGRGIATEALQQWIRHHATAGAMLSLRVEKGNAAHRLYARLGFKPVSEDEIAYEMVWQQG